MPDQFTDQDLQCADCGSSFVFTAGEQQFFSTKGFTPPKRCKPCRDAKKQQQGQQGGGGNKFGNRR